MGNGSQIRTRSRMPAMFSSIRTRGGSSLSTLSCFTKTAQLEVKREEASGDRCETQRSIRRSVWELVVICEAGTELPSEQQLGHRPPRRWSACRAFLRPRRTRHKLHVSRLAARFSFGRRSFFLSNRDGRCGYSCDFVVRRHATSLV
jgi:hypothetical protein